MIIRVFEAFAGYGSQMMAMRRVSRRHAGGADFQLVGWSEIDNDAIAAHNAVFPEYAECNHGDISKVDWDRVSDFDLFTYSFPCQDISNAGLQRGLQEGSGSRSSLLWECRKAIETKRPSFLLLENVAALASKKFMPDFQRWIDYLDEQGYKTYWKKINAKDFGVPQNRVRVFALSIRKDASAKFPQLFPSGIKYDFPQPFPLERRLRDILVTYHDGEIVEEKYYLKTEVILGRLKWNAETTTNHKFEYTEGGIANTIHCSTGTRGNTAQYVLEPKPIVEMNKYPSNHACGKVYNVGGVSPTVMNNHGETVSIAEPFVVASRGREPNVLTPKRTEEAKLLRKDYENHRINIQRKYMQQMEPRTDGVSNTITSVQKDNMLLEPLRIKANTREGFAEVEEYGAVNISQPSSRTRRGRVQGNKGDIIGTLLTGEENAVLEPKAEEVRRVAEEVRRQPCGVTVDKDNNLRPYRLDKAKSGVAELQTEFSESVGSTLTSARPNNVYGDTFPYRIRRLTPRECFRLMDVDDEDYNRIKNYVKGHRKNGKPMYISESQQYKLAGNSIVVACMEHIFEQLFLPSGRVTEPRQLDIFDII